MTGAAVSLRRGFTLNQWTVFPLEGRLLRDTEFRRVQPKSMDVLLCLAEAAGEVVERDELLRRIWGERAVSDEPLTRCIGELRRALGDQRGKPEYILTVPKRGYRLLAEAVPMKRDDESPAGSETPKLTESQEARRHLTIKRLVTGFGILVLAGLVQIVIERLLDETGEEVSPEQVVEELDPRSIAVLPFADLSVSGDQEHMSDGIAEEILNLLTSVADLRVISRSSSFSLKGQALDVRAIAERFKVAHVLEGSVRTSGDNIRISAKLIDARDESQVWSETYDRKMTDIFSIQDEIAESVVERLELSFRPGFASSRETDPETYALFLQARYLHEQPAGDSFQRAFDFYQAALEIDDTYVPAWVWLAALYDDTVYSSGLDRDEVERRIFSAIDRALEIDPDDPLALGMSAVLRGKWTGDRSLVVEQMRRALELDPGNPILLRWAAIVLNNLGQHEEAVRVTEYLFARDPVGNISRINLASTYLMAGRFADAIRICEIQVAAVGGTGPCHSRLIIAYLYSGNAAAARDQLDLTENDRVYTRLAPMVFYSNGEKRQFEAALSELHGAYSSGDIGLANWIARTYTFINDIDQAFEWLDRAHEQGVLDLTPTSAYFTHLHGDPRWQSLLENLDMLPEEMRGLDIKVDLFN